MYTYKDKPYLEIFPNGEYKFISEKEFFSIQKFHSGESSFIFRGILSNMNFYINEIYFRNTDLSKYKMCYRNNHPIVISKTIYNRILNIKKILNNNGYIN